MHVIGIIPARYASTRFPGKPLTNIHGKTMIQHVYERVSEIQSFSKVIVATDDERIYLHVKQFGGEVLMTSAAHASGTDRCGEVVVKLNEPCDVVVNIQGDEPFIKPIQLQLLIDAFNDNSVQIATLAKKITDQQEIVNSNTVKIIFGVNNKALYFSRSVIPGNKIGQVQTSIPYYKHLGIYAYRREILTQIIQLAPSKLEIAESLEQLRWLENGYTISIIETELETISIDTPEDLEKIKYLNI